MVQYVGRNGDLVLFKKDELGVVVNSKLDLVVEATDFSTLEASTKWDATSLEFSSSSYDIAAAALSTALVDSIVAGAGRMYTIPAGAKAEAKKALEWRKKHKRGGTPVGLNTARTLAKGGQIGIQKIRHIAKYFPRHEVDKKGKGWAPGEDNFPSNGRIAWALWGGDAAWRWARAIVERENKKALTADAYSMPSYQVGIENYPAAIDDANAFALAHEMDENYGPEFLVRVRMDGSGIDRLYKVDIDGSVCVWDDGCWDDLGHVNGDIYTYDKALDSPYDKVEKTYTVIDPASAVIISSRMTSDPYSSVSVESIDPEEASLMAYAIEEEDWELVDAVLTAAGEGAKPANPEGGEYPEELRSFYAKQQPRISGRFATKGQRVAVAGDTKRGLGTVESINEDGTVSVKMDSGNTLKLGANYLIDADVANSRPNATRVNTDYIQGRMDLSGIIGKPRTPVNQPKAQLPETLPPLDVEEFVSNYGSWVEKQRYKASSKSDKQQTKKDFPKAKFTEDFSITAAAEEESLTPATSDVSPRYLAIVSPDDKAAVMDLVAVVPATATSTKPITYIRKDREWVVDEQVLADLTSPTPPPVVEFKKEDQEVFNQVLLQVDDLDPEEPLEASAFSELDLKFVHMHAKDYVYTVLPALVAAGGADRNRGNAEELRRYWTRGKGAAKIRWGTPGDWTRCVRQLSKYLGPRAKGYCQLRHKEVTGVYTGSRKNPGNENSVYGLYSSAEEFDNAMIAAAELRAKAADLREKFYGLTAGAAETGSKFSIPLVIPEDIESGDGRKFKKESISIRELPLPLLWQIKTGDGHNGSVVVGRIDYMERTENGIGNAYGVFDTGAYGQEAERLVRNGFIRGVSADLDQFEAKESDSDNAEDEDEVGKKKLTINHARVMAVTIVPKPAFQECTISIDSVYGDQEDQMVPDDGIYEESLQEEFSAASIVASGFLAQEIPMTPPVEWFKNPGLTKPTPITVDESGRIYGHIAAWHVNHIGMPRSTRPPRSKSKYAYFHTGVVRCEDGTDMPVGQLTLAGGHASLHADAAAAAKHYDDTASAIADVHAGEDDYGIWVAGSLRPDATEAQIRALRASAPSGDWRPINGSLELVAVCQVNVPGFPIARAMVASGKVMALVAAGASEMAILKSHSYNTLATRAELFNQLGVQSASILERAQTQFGYIPKNEREKLAEEGKALPDGSYPIRNVEDLENAIQAYGRAKDKKAAKKHIIKRARALKKYDLIPEEWKKPKTVAASAQIKTLRQRALVAAAVAELAKFSDEERMKLAEKGMALPDGSYPIRNEQDLRNAIQAYGRSKPQDRLKVRKHITKRARALDKAYLIPEEWKSASSMEAVFAIESMRLKIASLVAATPAKEASEEDIKKLAEAKKAADEEQEAEIEAIKEAKTAPKIYDEEGRIKYTAQTQPRDARGKFRKVLARIKQDLGVAGLQDALKKVEEAENLEFAGNYKGASDAATDLLGLIDRLDTGALNNVALENVRLTAAELGKTIANLPLPFTNQAQKVRFSDLPPALKDLIDGMITRVEAKIGKEDADIATKELRSFMSGSDVYNQSEISSRMTTLLRLLT